ncbi:MAG: hypothetical protein M1823_002478 [Watsoniomyces obsoletus]|nr:MAG: hypothetical protein M1823_002478 [Watsoniomyces obsoletus]
MDVVNIPEAVADAAAANDLSTVNTLMKWWSSSVDTSSTTGLPQDTMLPFQPALHNALREGHLEIANILLKRGCKVDHEAAAAARRCKNPEAYGVLISHGWDINEYFGYIGDSLVCAVAEDKLDHVAYLLTHGADPNANLRGDSLTALELGAMFASLPVMDMLLAHHAQQEDHNALHYAASYGRLDVVNCLLDEGAAIDAMHETDNENIRQKGVGTPLYAAAGSGKSDVVRLLLKRGASKLVKDTAGRTAREAAVENGNHECAHLLE